MSGFLFLFYWVVLPVAGFRLARWLFRKNETINGSGDSDRLYGMGGNDILSGQEGDDYLCPAEKGTTDWPGGQEMIPV